MSYAIDWMTALIYLNSDTTNAFGKLTLTDTLLWSNAEVHFDEMVVTSDFLIREGKKSDILEFNLHVVSNTITPRMHCNFISSQGV